MERLVEEARTALVAPGKPIDRVSEAESHGPGLYAVHAAPVTWEELRLGERPDDRPLYLGKAEKSFASRDVHGHFGKRSLGSQSPTGGSTLRRSLAALLAARRGYRGVPRNPTKPGHFSNFGLSVEDDKDLSMWMADHLRLTLWPHDDGHLDDLETRVLRSLEPPLNLAKVKTHWQRPVRSARKTLAQQAKTWTA